MIPQQDARKALIARITRCLGGGSPEFVPCEMCRGGDPYCRNCGGVGEVLHPDENDEPRGLLRLALEALSECSTPEGTGTSGQLLDGASLIAHERRRVQAEKGCDAAHDDGHRDCELSKAAVAYIRHAQGYTDAGTYYPDGACEFNPSAGDPVRDLVKAGQLVAAEIDRLLRLHGVVTPVRVAVNEARRSLLAMAEGNMPTAAVVQVTEPWPDGRCACGQVVRPDRLPAAAPEVPWHTAHTCRIKVGAS